MARPPRIVYPHAVYHLTSRGLEETGVFRSDEDGEKFLSIVAGVVSRYGWVCHAYCLLNAHYHLLVETPRANLSLGMRQINGSYTQWFNRKHRRAGRVFQGRFKAILVQKGRPLLDLCRYVVMNPVRCGVVPSPEDYPWSSYRATAGLVQEPPFLTTSWLLNTLGLVPDQPRGAYVRFVMEGRDDRPWTRLATPLSFGDPDFAAQEKMYWNDRQTGRPSLRPPLAQLMGSPGGIRTAYQEYGYRLKEIATYLDVHESTVSRRLAASERVP